MPRIPRRRMDMRRTNDLGRDPVGKLLLRLAAALKNLEQSAETCYNIE